MKLFGKGRDLTRFDLYAFIGGYGLGTLLFHSKVGRAAKVSATILTIVGVVVMSEVQIHDEEIADLKRIGHMDGMASLMESHLINDLNKRLLKLEKVEEPKEEVA